MVLCPFFFCVWGDYPGVMVAQKSHTSQVLYGYDPNIMNQINGAANERLLWSCTAGSVLSDLMVMYHGQS